MAERCVRCNVGESEVRLYDAIYEGRMGSICERCSIIENVPIIKKPDSNQLKESEQGVGVFPRMKRLSGIKDEKPGEVYFREDKLNELESKPELEIPENEKLNLIEHFHWEIMKNRRRKGMSHQKLAESLGESVVAIEMIEKGKLPENVEILIKKLEQFFQVKLRKISEMEKYLKDQKKEPVLLDMKGNELAIVPEEEVETVEVENIDVTNELDIEANNSEEIQIVDEEIDVDEDGIEHMSGMDAETGEFDITHANLNEIKISHLQQLNRKKVEATKREQIEEQKKIEERNRLIEARKEELKLIKEKETDDLDGVLGGTELIGGNPEKEKEVDEESFDQELI
jgi:ribosome-binding protein aMBF1 (putative translation factor)